MAFLEVIHRLHIVFEIAESIYKPRLEKNEMLRHSFEEQKIIKEMEAVINAILSNDVIQKELYPGVVIKFIADENGHVYRAIPELYKKHYPFYVMEKCAMEDKRYLVEDILKTAANKNYYASILKKKQNNKNDNLLGH